MRFFTVNLLILSFFLIINSVQPLKADVVSTTLAPLPDFEVNGATLPRVDVLSVDLGPLGPDIVGKPGETVGWSFKLKWDSNAGDHIVFNDTTLGPDYEFRNAGKYTDLIGQVGGNQDGTMLAGSEWSSPEPFITNTHGIGYFEISPTAVPGTIYRGSLNIGVKVYAGVASSRVLLDQFVVTTEVSVVVGSVDLTDQTITFPEITEKKVTHAPFVLGAQSSSQLPIQYISMKPDLCSIENGVATIHAAGQVAIAAVQEGNTIYNPAPEVVRNFEITKNPATVVIQGSMNQTYNGSDKTFSAVTTPAGLNVKWLCNGEETLPKEPGIYLINAVIESPTYEGVGHERLVISDTSAAPLQAYSDWLLENFTNQEIQAGLVTVKDAVLAGDGSSNLFKYAFGIDAKTPMSEEARAALPRLVSDASFRALVFDMPVTGSSDLVIKIQASSDMNNWSEIARRTRGGEWTGTASVFTGTPNIAGDRAQTIVNETSTQQQPSVRFYRIAVDFNP
jgi:MBG domain